VAKDSLVTPEIEAGQELLKAIDREGLPVRTAFWYYLPDSEQWRLILASPLVDESGPSAAYGRVQGILDKLELPMRDALPLAGISVVSPASELPRLISAAIRTAEDSSSPISFKANTVNGVYIDNAIIYRSS
jgi:hypothetical protein